ncbi:thiamine pyrophosphate-binding protein [Cupriavidus necator]|uniref:thiamine pyrophosphate-binding protein n=1 Tax=Cupriavidus necator TaxID=106590 RepID=UPI00339D8615
MRFDELFLRVMSKLGVTKCFGIVGGEAEAIRFNKSFGVDFYLTRHEFVAGVMADVAGRLTGKPHMCSATFGPGLTNIATGACSGMLDRSPMIVCSAQIPRSQVKFNLTHQCIDNVGLMSGITKSSLQLETVQDLTARLPGALQCSIDELPGPAYISIPVDLMKEDVPDDTAFAILHQLQSSVRGKAAVPSSDDVALVAAAIAAASHPMIVLGNQVIREGAEENVRCFAEKINAPVICSLAAKGALPEDHPQFLTAANKYLDGVYRRPILGELFDQVDLMILIGYDFGEDLKPSLWGGNKPTIEINSFDVPMGEVFQPDLRCRGNIAHNLDQLTNYPLPRKVWMESHNRLKHCFDQRRPVSHPAELTDISRIIAAASDSLGRSGIMCSDVGLHKQYAGLLARTYRSNRFLCSNVCGSFGFGLPAGMAAKMCHPEERVLAICGDGGFHSTSQDLETLARYSLPLVVLVLSDSAFGLIKYYQKLSQSEPDRNLTGFGHVDFTQLAAANGVDSTKVEDVTELPVVLERAFRSGRPHLVEMEVKYDYDLLHHVA